MVAVPPLLFFGILYLFFTKIVGIGNGTPHYGVYLLTGIVLWNYLAEATGTCVSCLVAREALLRKIRFPRLAIPLSVSLTATFNLATNSAAVVIFALLDGLTPGVALARDDPRGAGHDHARDRPGHDALGLLRPLSRRGTDLGGGSPGLVLRLADHVHRLGLWGALAPVLRLGEAEHLALINPVATLLTQMGHALIGGREFPLR